MAKTQNINVRASDVSISTLDDLSLLLGISKGLVIERVLKSSMIILLSQTKLSNDIDYDTVGFKKAYDSLLGLPIDFDFNINN